MGFMFLRFPGHSRTGFLLHSRNVIVLLELWQVARSWMKIYHNAFTFHLNIMNNIALVFPLSILPFTFLRSDRPLLLMAPRLAHLLAILQQSEYTLQDSSYSVCTKHDNGVDCYNCIFLTLKELEHS